MATCPRCGSETSIWARDILSGVCTECTETEARNERQRKKAEELAVQQASVRRAEEEEAERKRRIRSRVAQIKSSLLKRLERGQTVYLYHSVYLPVDSVLLDEPLSQGFDIAPLVTMGFQGWETIGVVPKTVGVGLKNTSIGSTMGVTWGGASGGNVAGVHVLLRRVLAPADIDIEADDEIAKVIMTHIRVIP